MSKISEVTKKEAFAATDSVPIGAANSNAALRVTGDQIKAFCNASEGTATASTIGTVRVKLSNGLYGEISKSDFATAIATVLGQVEGAATDFVLAQVMDGSATPKKITKANMANVLSEAMGNPLGTQSVYTGEDLNDCIQNGIYLLDTRAYANKPLTGYAVLVVHKFGSSTQCVQTITSIKGNAEKGEAYTRTISGASVSAWIRIDNFGYSTLSELSSAVNISNHFYSGIVEGTDGTIEEIASEVVAALPNSSHISFSVIHQGQTRKCVQGYVYSGKAYGSMIIQKYDGTLAFVRKVGDTYTSRAL